MKGKHTFGASLVRVLLWPVSILPLGFHRSCGRAVGRIAGSLLGYRRDVVLTNISRCFPEMNYDEVSAQCELFYRHFGTLICEALWFGSTRNTRRLRKADPVHISGGELLEKYRKEGKSVIIAFSHSGNWELLGGYQTYIELNGLEGAYPEKDMHIVYRRLASKVWNDFMNSNRIAPAGKDGESQMLESFEVLRYVISHRRESKAYVFMTDQYPYSDSSRVPLDNFFGMSTVSMDGAFAIAHRLGLPMLYMYMRQNEDRSYTLELSELCPDASKQDKDALMRSYYALLERDIRTQPWNYLWTHKRWK